MAKSPQLNVRVSPEKLAELQKIAERDGRTLSNLTQKIIDDFLVAQKKKR